MRKRYAPGSELRIVAAMSQHITQAPYHSLTYVTSLFNPHDFASFLTMQLDKPNSILKAYLHTALRRPM